MSGFNENVRLLVQEYVTATSAEVAQALHCGSSQMRAITMMPVFRKRDAEELQRRMVPDPKFVRIMRRRILERRERAAA